MKITDELRNKIKQTVREQYADAIKTSAQNNEVLKTKAADEIIADIKAACAEHQHLTALLSLVYRNWEDIVRGNLKAFETSQELTDAQNNHQLLLDTVDNKISNLLVTVSYGKDIEDIKKAFGEYGLKF